MPLSKNYNELFIEPEKGSSNWINRAIELSKKGDADALYEVFQEANEFYFQESNILHALSNFTKDLPTKKRINSLKELSKNSNYSVQIHESHVGIKSDSIKIDALKFSDVFEGIKDIYPEIVTEKRLGNCHMRSIELSILIEDSNKVVTGFIYGLSDKDKILHSWIETKINNTDVVIDFTMNIIINKDAYYRLKHVEALNAISDKDLINDDKFIHFFAKSVHSIDVKEYLLFRDEIIRDCKKNKQLFKNMDFLDEER